MAIITPGPTVAAISGSIGGTVYSRNRGGAYIRNRAIPVDPNTTAQQNARAILSNQSQAWQGLTDSQRAAWSNWAKQNPVTNTLGNSILLSGHQAYVQLNARLDLDDQTQISLPPIVAAPTALDSLVIDGDEGAGDVDATFTATPLGANVKLWLTAAVVNSAGISYVRNLLRFIGTSAAAQTSPYDYETQIETKFGALIVGQRIFLRVSTFDTATGLLSVALEDSVTVTTS